MSPLGLIKATAGAVEVYFDRDLQDEPRLGFHPNDNTATIFLSFADVLRYIESTGHTIRFIQV